jgi:hypothetical protein
MHLLHFSESSVYTHFIFLPLQSIQPCVLGLIGTEGPGGCSAAAVTSRERSKFEAAYTMLYLLDGFGGASVPLFLHFLDLVTIDVRCARSKLDDVVTQHGITHP